MANGYWTNHGQLAVANGSYTAAQLAAMALAGTLTPYATYVASDTGARYWASNASTLLREDGAAAIMQFGARPNAADVPEGYVIAGTEIFGAKFVAMTKGGITDWYPQGGVQVIGVWTGEATLYVASTTQTLVKQTGLLVPAGVMGLNGSLTIKMMMGQLWNTTASGTPTFWPQARLRRLSNSTVLTLPVFNDSFGTAVGVSSSSTETNKKAGFVFASLQMLGDPMSWVVAPDASTSSNGYQSQYSYQSMEYDAEVDIYSAASATNCAGKLVAVELTVRG